MYDWDCDNYCEQSELDNAFDEFTERVRELAKDDVKQIIQENIKCEQKLKEKRDKLWDKEKQLKNRSDELDRREKEFEDQLDAEVIKRLEKLGFLSKFKVGNEAYIIRMITKYKDCTNPDCKDGYVDIVKDKISYHFKCPICSYNGKIESKFYRIQKIIINDIFFEYRINKSGIWFSRDSEGTIDKVYFLDSNDNRQEVSYHDLFLTLEEAQIEAARRNSEENKY